jgi:hypothetical protein
MVNLSEADLTELNQYVAAEQKAAYAKWLADKNKKEAETLTKNKSDARNFLSQSLQNVTVTKKRSLVPKAEAVKPYPLKFADDQLLNKWLEKSLKDIESGSKPLAILEAITGLALLEGKLMNLVMTVLNGVLTDDDLVNMTVYGIKSFATTRFAKLFFDDFGTMLPVMNEVGSPLEVLQIVDKLRESMANPEGNKPTAQGSPEGSPEVSAEEMMATLNKWYSGDTREQLTQYLVENFKFAAPPLDPTSPIAAPLPEASAPPMETNVETALASAPASAAPMENNLQKALPSAPLMETNVESSELNPLASAPASAAPMENNLQKALPSAPPMETNVESSELNPPARTKNIESNLPTPEEDRPPPAEGEKPYPLDLGKKSTSQAPSQALQGGGTRRHAAPSQALTRKRWFEVTLRDVLSGTR